MNVYLNKGILIPCWLTLPNIYIYIMLTVVDVPGVRISPLESVSDAIKINKSTVAKSVRVLIYAF